MVERRIEDKALKLSHNVYVEIKSLHDYGTTIMLCCWQPTRYQCHSFALTWEDNCHEKRKGGAGKSVGFSGSLLDPSSELIFWSWHWFPKVQFVALLETSQDNRYTDEGWTLQLWYSAGAEWQEAEFTPSNDLSLVFTVLADMKTRVLNVD